MKISTIISSVILASTFGLISCGSSDSKSDTNNIAMDSPSEGEVLFNQVCTKCHRTSPPETKADRMAMLAPPIKGVMFHVNDGIKANNPTEKKEKVIAFIVDYAHNPSADKSFCEKHAIERFGIMPSQKSNISKEELTLVAEFLYQKYPSGEIDHETLQKQMHGN